MKNYNGIGVIKYAGFLRTKDEWADIIGISKRQLNRRIQKWGLKRAMTTPGNSDKCKFIYKGKADSICWDCKHCVPDPDNNIGCSWSRMEGNVEGSVASVKLITYSEGNILAHVMRSCPEFCKSNKCNSLWGYKLNEYKRKNNRKS